MVLTPIFSSADGFHGGVSVRFCGGSQGFVGVGGGGSSGGVGCGDSWIRICGWFFLALGSGGVTFFSSLCWVPLLQLADMYPREG